ncbi:MAG: TauD/TfdA family dioxygenase [Proteobacteria bacterium]|nr:TauD/TfdA family dioxygenase [Burkholderiales bacterium]
MNLNQPSTPAAAVQSPDFNPALALQVVPTGKGIGADVTGVDLSFDIDDATLSIVRDAWLEHQVLRFRDQQLTKDQLLAFSRRFGTLDKAPINRRGRHWIDGYPELAVMSNIKVGDEVIGSLGYGEAVWHTDMSYQELTPSAALLYAVELPSAGGETGFMDMYAAYETLPTDLKAAVEGATIKHDASHNSAGELRKGFEAVTDPREAPGAVHPVVVRHPESGRRALFLGRRPNAYVTGLSLAESESLLDRLWAHCVGVPFVWFQEWRIGDLVMWDNRCTMHKRNAFDANERRLLLRTTVKAGRPQA